MVVCTYIDHAASLQDLPDEYLRDTLPIAKRVAIATGGEGFQHRSGEFFLSSPPLHFELRHLKIDSDMSSPEQRKTRFPGKFKLKLTPKHILSWGSLQHVDHVHFHVIPKPNKEEGVCFDLDVTFKQKHPSQDELKAVAESIRNRFQELK